ncbi:hypothetical protein ABGW26_03780 [Leuconostoc falkenbergense]|uniref:hypothetical protein n=1 Tax=Leuconostoc falkenbergense TaxID=2766470 RepID=UPI0002738AA8|nr:hypothetical protein [Leuconostoc falkenbergense]OQJ67841.1 hypothetical protein BMS78_08965 [Leuconostoc pseudomesenteroides]CCJ67528.1 hypothetical protein Q5C_07855 [Leuconostoc pseudomesenteroides 4882]OQJ69887.1 hypothetical protein BMS79_08040 [Leuconostoc pseudomesenteroides]OQJ79306.1 hypothetical protein BMS81_08415 [Leuconostoc pseudomesenteroides]OQJ80955.1 hypothetical protein BMS84_10135 [Leuconostoc pseudomesenteroides]
MSKVNKKIALLWAIPALMVIAGLGFWLATQVAVKTHQSASNELAVEQSKLINKKSKVGTVLDSKQPNVSAASNLLDKLFTLDWTIASQKEFDAKAKQMTPYVTQDVVKNSLDFKADPDNLITQTGVVMTYDHMDFLPTSASTTEVKGKVIVFVKSHLKDSADATTRFVYNVTYNPKTNLVTQLDRIGTYQLQSDSSVL